MPASTVPDNELEKGRRTVRQVIIPVGHFDHQVKRTHPAVNTDVRLTHPGKGGAQRFIRSRSHTDFITECIAGKRVTVNIITRDMAGIALARRGIGYDPAVEGNSDPERRVGGRGCGQRDNPDEECHA
jgi:hypothetical protein